MDLTWVSVVAGVITTASNIPQLIKVLRTRNTRDLSIWMYIALETGMFCWFIYAIWAKEVSLMISNGLGVLINGVILVFIIYNLIKNKKTRETSEL